MSNRGVVERYARALAENDGDALAALRDEDYVARYPQSGEIIRGRTNARAVGENYPGPTSSIAWGRNSWQGACNLLG